ncbi:MAG: phosphate regulon transcriptional regulator PhoB [Pseudomonadota bacterium]
MSSPFILIVDDEESVRQMLDFGLRRAGFETGQAATCAEARTALADREPDLILMDWMLPEMSGIEFTRQLRRDPALGRLPVIMLTARAGQDDKIAGLDSGADDYVTKPFSTRELISRIRAVLRRKEPAGEDVAIEVEGLVLDSASHRVTAGDAAVNLGPTEFRLLQHFMQNPERVYSRAQLLDRVWGANVYVEERTVDVHIRRLRKALTPSGHDRLVQTVRGAGYRFSGK